MKGMIHHMILFDLDGTLLTSGNIVSSITADVIKNCKLKGYRIGFITARSRSKKNIFLLEGLPYDFIAFYNGAEIYTEKHLIESNVLPYKQAMWILKRLNEDFSDIVIDVHLEPWNFSNASGNICHMESGTRKVCNLNDLPRYDVQRIRLESEDLMSIPLQNYMTNESTFYYTTYGDAIIVHKNANKEYVTKWASDFFNIPPTQMIAFGDDVNDINMIKIVGTGVAMGNAIPSLKKIANYVTETNDNNGIAIWINEHLFQQENNI